MKLVDILSLFLLICRANGFAVRQNNAYPPFAGRGDAWLKSQAKVPELRMSTVSDYRSVSPGSIDLKSFANNFYLKYLDLCQYRPFLAKGLTAAVIAGCGDVLSQYVEAVGAGSAAFFVANKFRSLAFAMTGMLFVGPFLHVWYEQLWKIGSWMEAKFGSCRRKQTIAQLVIDQTIGIAIFFPIYFFAFEAMEALVGFRAPAFGTARAKMMEQLGPVIKANYVVWPLVTYINFSFIPPSLRVLASNFVSIFWNIFLCSKMA